MSTLNKLSISFANVQIWKQYNKLWDRSTVSMDEETLMSHRETIRVIKIDLQFTTWNVAEVQDRDDEYNLYVL
jgi:hypothetical protein